MCLLTALRECAEVCADGRWSKTQFRNSIKLSQVGQGSVEKGDEKGLREK
jgi:hypothetical protein